MFCLSSGERTSSGVSYSNNNDSVLFCLGTGLSFWLNHTCLIQFVGTPSLCTCFQAWSPSMEQHQRERSVAAPWWVSPSSDVGDRQLCNRRFVQIFLKSVLKVRSKWGFLLLHSQAFYLCWPHCSLHSPCHKSKWNENLNLSQPERATWSKTSSGRSTLQEKCWSFIKCFYSTERKRALVCN